MPFNSRRLSIARKRRLLNKKELAQASGLSEYTILRHESGKTIPTDEVVASFARVLRFPIDFFYGADVEEPVGDTASFRSQASMTASIRDAALAAGSLGYLISDYVEERFDLPNIAIPELSFYSPEQASRTLREEWGLGEKPISNMIHLLESKGARVFSLAENSLKVNAFSLWRRSKPYVFLNTMKTAENSRFDAAHELGHLVLHQDGKAKGREAEDQANRFASSFLMPKDDVLAELPYVVSMEQMIQKKQRWRVSLAALNYRLHKLGLTTEWQNRNFCIQIARGYGKKEPNPIEREKSVVWEKVLRALWTERVTRSDIAKALHLPESEVEALVFGVLGDSGARPSGASPLAVVSNSRSS